MITYAKDHSPFYYNHEEFCKTIDDYAVTVNGKVLGYCDSYGYEATLTFQKDSIPFEAMFTKTQSTQNGIIIPVNSLEYVGFVFKATLPDSGLSFTYGKSALKRLLTRSSLKKLIPKGQYLFLSSGWNSDSAIQVAKLLGTLGSDEATLKDGQLTITRHMNTQEPRTAMEELVKLTGEILQSCRR